MRTKRGFTLTEIIIVVAILAVVAAVAIPALSRANENQALNGATRALLADIVAARQLATTGKKDTSWGPTEVAKSAGLLIQPNGYQLFFDRNMVTDGDEIVTRAVQFTGKEDHLSFVGAPIEIRFKRNGTLHGNPPADQNVSIQDARSGRVERVTVFFGGTARLN